MNTIFYPNIDLNNNLNADKFLSELLISQSTSERKVQRIIRKSTGLFLTNKLHTIDNILDVVPIDQQILNKVILEPACGEGIFLLRILTKIYEKFPEEEIIKKYIQNNLIFVDISEEMIEKTKTNINNLYKLFFGEDYKNSYNCYVYDFTKKFIEDKHTLFRTDHLDYPLSKFLGKVDYVIGNPPYVSLYGRRDKKQNEEQRIYYLTNYDQFPRGTENGKINLVMLFLEHSLDFLKEDGKLGFIIDVSFFETAYKHTRKYLLENTNINSIEVNIKDFEVASGQVIIKLTKSSNNQSNEVVLIDHLTKKRQRIKQHSWLNSVDEYRFRFNHYGESESILRKIQDKKDKTILELYPNKNLRTCTMLLNMENRFTYTDAGGLDQNFVFPYYEGSRSLKEKYGELKFQKYFYYNKQLQDSVNDQLKIELIAKGIKNKKRIGFGEKIIYDSPKVYIRQSAKEIIATLDLERSSANNSLYVFSLRDSNTKTVAELKFICGWLNSDLMTFYAQIRHIIRFSNGKQPQIKTSDLGSLPLPMDPDLKKKIIEQVSKIYEDKKTSIKRMQIINELVYKYYSLTPTEIKYIETSIKSF